MGFIEGLSKWVMQHVFGQDAVEHVPAGYRPIYGTPYMISDGPITFEPLVPSMNPKLMHSSLEWESVIHTADVKDWTHGILIGVLGCARCGQDHPDNHPLAFLPFDRPVMDADGTWTHWAICPNTGDPVLLRQQLPTERRCQTCEFWDKFDYDPHFDGTRWSFCRRPDDLDSAARLPDEGVLNTRADFMCSEYQANRPERDMP